MNQVTLYQKSASTRKGKIWQIRVDQKTNSSDIIIESGQFNLETNTPGKLVKNTIPVTEGKNLGKANETNHYTQAVSEAQSRIEQQTRKGYVDDVSKITSSDVLGSGVRAPMLAQKYHPTGKQKGSKTLKQMKIEGQKIIVQPKLDGNRCVITVRKGEAFMSTRKGDLMPVQLEHILNNIRDSFDHQNDFDELILDGELYRDPSEMRFNTLNGLLKKQSASPQQIEDRKKIEFHIYDVMLDEGYEKRLNVVRRFKNDSVIPVESKVIVATDENIQTELEHWLSLGYEGLMIRILGKGYENKRSWQLVKVKLFEDAEFKLIGFVEDVRGGFVGKFTMELPKPVKDADGKILTDFGAGASGQNVEERTYMWNNPDEFIGKIATVEFFGWDFRPRFAKFKGIREDI